MVQALGRVAYSTTTDPTGRTSRVDRSGARTVVDQQHAGECEGSRNWHQMTTEVAVGKTTELAPP